jgi:sensor domain CHASE-containing protein
MRQAILKDREVINSKVSAVADQIAAVVNQRLQLTYSLAAYAKVKENITEDDFLRFADAAIGDATGILSLQLAPNAIIAFLTNKKENSKALGYDLLSDPKRRLLAETSIKERRYVIEGPVNLVQGGREILPDHCIEGFVELVIESLCVVKHPWLV